MAVSFSCRKLKVPMLQMVAEWPRNLCIAFSTHEAFVEAPLPLPEEVNSKLQLYR